MNITNFDNNSGNIDTLYLQVYNNPHPFIDKIQSRPIQSRIAISRYYRKVSLQTSAVLRPKLNFLKRLAPLNCYSLERKWADKTPKPGVKCLEAVLRYLPLIATVVKPFTLPALGLTESSTAALLTVRELSAFPAKTHGFQAFATDTVNARLAYLSRRYSSPRRTCRPAFRPPST